MSSADERSLNTLIIYAERDELIPLEHGVDLENKCRNQAMPDNRKEICGAFHTKIVSRNPGRQAIVVFIRSMDNHKFLSTYVESREGKRRRIISSEARINLKAS